MKRPNKKQIGEALTEFRSLSDQKAAIEGDRDLLIAPLKAEFDKLAGPLIKTADERIRPLAKRLAELQAQIEEGLLAGVGDDGSVMLSQVAVDGAIAEVAMSVTRTIAPEDWIEATPPASRDRRFWECVSILITKVDKHFGTQFERLIEKKAKPRVTIRFVDAPVAETEETAAPLAELAPTRQEAKRRVRKAAAEIAEMME